MNKTIAWLIVFAFAWFFIYAFFHEAGHALVGMAYGGTVERFVFWNFNAHVVVTDAEFTAFGRALFHAAGNLFPILLTTVVFAFYKPTIRAKAYHICHLIPVISIIGGALMGWVIIPIRTIFAPVSGEDAARFLDTTGFHPLLVVLMAILILSAFVLFAHAKGILYNAVIVFFSLYKDTEKAETHFNSKYGIVSLVLVLTAVGTLGLAQIVPYIPSNVIHIQLEIADVRDEVRYEHRFIVVEGRSHTINLNVHGKGFLTGLRISDEEGTQILGTFGETTFSVMGITLVPGVYFATFYFMTDWDTVKTFYYAGEAEEYLVDKTAHPSYEVFARATGDYSVVISMTVR